MFHDKHQEHQRIVQTWIVHLLLLLVHVTPLDLAFETTYTQDTESMYFTSCFPKDDQGLADISIPLLRPRY